MDLSQNQTYSFVSVIIEREGWSIIEHDEKLAKIIISKNNTNGFLTYDDCNIIANDIENNEQIHSRILFKLLSIEKDYPQKNTNN